MHSVVREGPSISSHLSVGPQITSHVMFGIEDHITCQHTNLEPNPGVTPFAKNQITTHFVIPETPSAALFLEFVFLNDDGRCETF
jgi:hypothetical protein